MFKPSGGPDGPLFWPPPLTLASPGWWLGIGDGLVRFSAGLEHPDDVVEDLLSALDEV